MKQREDTDILEIKLNILHKLFAIIYNGKTAQENLSEVTDEGKDLLVSHNVDLLAFLAKIEDMHNEDSSELGALLRQECLEELAKIRDIILNKEYISLIKYSTTCDVERDMSMPNSKITRI